MFSNFVYARNRQCHVFKDTTSHSKGTFCRRVTSVTIYHFLISGSNSNVDYHLPAAHGPVCIPMRSLSVSLGR